MARELGFTLDVVRASLRLRLDGCIKVRGVAAAHVANVQVPSPFQAMECVLTDTVRWCDAGEEATCR